MSGEYWLANWGERDLPPRNKRRVARASTSCSCRVGRAKRCDIVVQRVVSRGREAGREASTTCRVSCLLDPARTLGARACNGP